MSGLLSGESAVVVGYGASGQAAAAALLREGASVRVTEARAPDELTGPEAPPGDGLEILAGGHRPEHLDGATLVVVSPGVPESAPVMGWARGLGLPIWSELELGARLSKVPYLAVTGTNGKTTTVELLAAILAQSGMAARACGNVGYPFSTAVADPSEVLVVEASSFQLRFTETFHPRVSVLLNLAPDHLDWHGSFERYASAKAAIYARQVPGDTHVGNREDAESARISAAAPCDVRWFGWGPPAPGDVGVSDARIVWAEGRNEVDLGSPQQLSRGFLLDAAAAASAALAFSVPPDAVEAAVSAFEPLPHRGDVVARVGGVTFVDDSKATNPAATLAALDGLEDVVLIAGGLSKGIDLSPLASAASRLRMVVAMGAVGAEVAAVFEGRVPVEKAGSIEESVTVAWEAARPGDTVLLAPACASQDMFRDYRERGDRFARAARTIEERTHA